jgi:hypothetical protein
VGLNFLLRWEILMPTQRPKPRVVSQLEAGTIWEIRNWPGEVVLLLEIRGDLPQSAPLRYLAAATAFTDLIEEARKIYTFRDLSDLELGSDGSDPCNPVLRFILVRAILNTGR